MPRDSSGVYSLPDGYLAVTGNTIQPTQHNSPLEDIALALTGSMPRNGTAPMTAPLKLPDGSSSAPALAFSSATGTGFAKTADGVGLYIAGALIAEFTANGVKGAGVFTGISVTGGAASTDPETGDVVVDGGVGIGGAINAGGRIGATGDIVSGAGLQGTTLTTTGLVTAGDGLTVSGGEVTLPAGSVTNDALVSPPKFTKEYVSSPTTFSLGTPVAFTHGLGGLPKLVRVVLKCTTASGGYSVGDEVDLGSFASVGAGLFLPFAAVAADTTTITVVPSNLSLNTLTKSTGVIAQNLTVSSWSIVVRAWA